MSNPNYRSAQRKAAAQRRLDDLTLALNSVENPENIKKRKKRKSNNNSNININDNDLINNTFDDSNNNNIDLMELNEEGQNIMEFNEAEEGQLRIENDAINVDGIGIEEFKDNFDDRRKRFGGRSRIDS